MKKKLSEIGGEMIFSIINFFVLDYFLRIFIKLSSAVCDVVQCTEVDLC